MIKVARCYLAYIQALTENVVREDMSSYEIALALKEIKDATGYTNEQIGAMFGWAETSVISYLNMLDFADIIKPLAREVTHHHVIEARAGTTTDKDAAEVLKIAVEEELSQRKTRQVAEVITDARQFGGQKAVNRLLKKQADEILRGKIMPPFGGWLRNKVLSLMDFIASASQASMREYHKDY